MLLSNTHINSKVVQKQGGHTCLNCGNQYKRNDTNNGQCHKCNLRAVAFYRHGKMCVCVRARTERQYT